jgi:hypothetical protein
LIDDLTAKGLRRLAGDAVQSQSIGVGYTPWLTGNASSEPLFQPSSSSPFLRCTYIWAIHHFDLNKIYPSLNGLENNLDYTNGGRQGYCGGRHSGSPAKFVGGVLPTAPTGSKLSEILILMETFPNQEGKDAL